MALDRSNPEAYPPNVQAILKRPAPAAAFLGQELLSIDVAAGVARIGYRLDERHLNRFGAVHGGITALIMDDVISVAAGLSIQWGEITPTLEMKVSYLAQARPGRVTGEARVIRRGRQVMFLEATLEDEEGRMLARASSTIMVSAMKGASSGTRTATD